MGIDPAQFSHGLCEYMAETCHSLTEDRHIEQLRARELMQTGLQKVMKDRSIHGGGSTACVGIARSNGSLQVAKYDACSIQNVLTRLILSQKPRGLRIHTIQTQCSTPPL